MKRSPQPITQDLVLIGGGHSHAIALRKFGMNPVPGVRITLITDLPHTPYSGMLPGLMAGTYSFDTAHIDLRPLSQFAQARLFIDRAVGLDLANQRVICANRPPVAFDYLSIDTGSTPAKVTVPGALEHAIPAKPVPQILRRWDAWLTELAADPQRSRRVVIVGGGAGGVELTFNMQARLRRLYQAWKIDSCPVEFHLFQRSPTLAAERNRRTQQLLTRHLRDRGVQLHLSDAVVEVKPGQVCSESGLQVDCDRVFWVTNASAPDWIQGSGLATDERGFIAVGDTLQSTSHPQVFAAGDVATMIHHPRPKAGVFAVRQGTPLFKNLTRVLTGRSPRPFVPQRQFLTLIDTGDYQAIASRWNLAGRSPWFWRLKDWIDCRFMNQFKDLPTMSGGGSTGTTQNSKFKIQNSKRYGSVGLTDSNSVNSVGFANSTHATVHAAMRCGGCGSKVGNTVLQAALKRVQADISGENSKFKIQSSKFRIPPAPDRATVVIGLDSPDDAAVMQVPGDRWLVQTVDFFRALLDDPYLFGEIATQHALSDLFAMGATPTSGLAIAAIPELHFAKQTETLYQLLAGATQSLHAAGASLIGGHTVEGTELAFGLTCNGMVAPDQLMRKGGLQPGQGLILTKAIGTGTLFAADMQYQAKGRWIEAAIASMRQSNQAAAQIIQQHRGQACTDVTGFGLVGHLAEMVAASAPVTVNLWFDQIAFLPGTQTLTQQGFRSSLYPANAQGLRAIANLAEFEHHPDFPLLADPQTAGGLLAAVPAEHVETCVKALQRAGYDAARAIGRIQSAPQAGSVNQHSEETGTIMLGDRP